MDKIKDDIKSSYERLQTLEIKSTLYNLETMLQTLYDLRNAYNEIEEIERSKDDGRIKTDPE